MTTLKEQFAHVSKYGLARSNRFQILIPLPQMLQERLGNPTSGQSSGIGSVIRDISVFLGGSPEVTRGLEIMTESSEFPGKQLTTTDVRYNGDIYRMPYAVLYNTHPINFRCSQDMHEKNILDEWMNMIFNPKDHTIEYHDNVVTDITINQLDVNDRITHTVVLEEAMPTMSNPIPLSNEDRDTFSRISAQFGYRRYLSNKDLENDGTGVSSLTQTPLGPIVTPVLANPIVQRGLNVVEQSTGIDLDGEGAAFYNRIDEVMRNTTGSSVNQSASIYESLKASALSNNKLSETQRNSIVGTIDTLLDVLRG